MGIIEFQSVSYAYGAHENAADLKEVVEAYRPDSALAVADASNAEDSGAAIGAANVTAAGAAAGTATSTAAGAEASASTDAVTDLTADTVASPTAEAGAGGATGAGADAGAGAATGAGADAGAGAATTSSEQAATGRPTVAPYALHNLTLSIEPGDFVAFIGSNGSGKSTLAMHVNALLKPTFGTVLTLGLDTSDDELCFEIRSHAAMVFQNPDSQIVSNVVADDVAFGPENLAVPYTEMHRRVDEALGTVKMSDFADRNPARLSGGQKQRVCIAGVLAMQPDVLILDEPCAMLDVRGRRGIRRLIRELNAMGITIILITHFMKEAMLAKRVYVLDRGHIALVGSPEAVFSNKTVLRELSLDLPFSLLLTEELIKRGLKVSEIASPKELKEELRCLYSTK